MKKGGSGPVHVEALRRLGIRVKGILCSSPAKSEAAATTLGLPKAYVSYEEILSDPEVDVVHIATPNREHRDMVIGALDAGNGDVLDAWIDQLGPQWHAHLAMEAAGFA